MPLQISEHFGLIGKVNRNIVMEPVIFNYNDVTAQMKKIKNKRAPVPDGIIKTMT